MIHTLWQPEQPKQNVNASIASRVHVKLANVAASGRGELNEASVLSAMQQSLEKATEEMGQAGKLLLALQADMTEIKETSAGLRTDVDRTLVQLDEPERRISQLKDENCQLRQTEEKSAKKCEELHQAVEDAADRDRRQNLRLIGPK